MGIYAPIATGLPAGVTEANVAPPEPTTHRGKCACRCGRTVDTAYEHYRDSHGQLFYDEDCVARYYEFERVG